jgi:uncharacterized Zn finger protein (UPF0148 family)
MIIFEASMTYHEGAEMIYTCGNCHFMFERTGEILSCPDCGRPDIRQASEEEQAEYIKTRPEPRRKERDNSKK